MIGAKSKRGQDIPIWCCKVSAKRMSRHKERSGSLVSLGSDNNRRSVNVAAGNRVVSAQMPKLEVFHVYRQENVNQDVRKVGQKDFTRPKCEEHPSSIQGKLYAV